MKTGKLCAAVVLIVTAAAAAFAQDGAGGLATDFTRAGEAPLAEHGDFVLRGTELVQYRGKGDAEVVIPANLGITAIGDNVFEGAHIRSVAIPAGVERIGARSFKDCYNLESVVIPGTVSRIGDRAFTECGRLKEIRVDGANAWYTDRDGVLFTKNPAVLVYYPAGKDAPSYAIPEGVTRIEGYAFQGCEGLKSVSIPDGVTSIGDYAFYGCGGLTGIKIPDGVTSIGNFAFYWCGSLAEVSTGNGVTSIGDFAFYGCGSLAEVSMGNGVTSIGGRAFSGCRKLTAIQVDRGNRVYTDRDGVLFTKDLAVLVQYPAGKDGSSYSIPDGVTGIGNYAFRGCGNLAGINIPDGVTSIGDYAFSECGNLAGVKIPDSVTSIGDSAFSWCRSLGSITLHASRPPDIPGDLLYRSSRATIYVPAAALEAYKNAPGWRDYADRIRAIE
jgi:hypothetical protein